MPDVPMIQSIGPLPCQEESSEETVRRLFRNDMFLAFMIRSTCVLPGLLLLESVFGQF